MARTPSAADHFVPHAECGAAVHRGGPLCRCAMTRQPRTSWAPMLPNFKRCFGCGFTMSGNEPQPCALCREDDR